MIQLSKKAIIFWFLLSFIVSISRIIIIFNNNNLDEIYSNISGFFLGLSLMSAFLNYYSNKLDQEGFLSQPKSLMSKPITTLLLILLGVFLFAYFIVTILNTESLTGMIIFRQISTIILGLISFYLLITLHVKLIKQKPHLN